MSTVPPVAATPSTDNVRKYGYTPVVRDPDVLLKDHPTASGANPKQASYSLDELPLPDSPLIRRAKAFVQDTLDTPTFNHSHRVYYYGVALVLTHFPDWGYSSDWAETYYLCCLFHDIGATERYLPTTKMSFEFKGAIVAREFILKNGGEEDLADAICEAVIRHQDIFVQGGNITAVGQALQLATIIDNVGLRANLISPTLIESVIEKFPRLAWSSCFSSVIEKELTLKPWCHTSTFEVPGWKEGGQSNFATQVRGNKLMNAFD